MNKRTADPLKKALIAFTHALSQCDTLEIRETRMKVTFTVHKTPEAQKQWKPKKGER